MALTFAGLVLEIIQLVNTAVIPTLFALAVIFFLINIVRFFFIESGEEAQDKGKKALLWGGIGLAVLFSIWGIVNLLVGTLDQAVGVTPGTTATTTPPTQTTNYGEDIQGT